MGPDPPKSSQRDELLSDLEELVKDAILTGEIGDPVLASLMEVTIYSVLNERPLFENPLREPAFYRKYFYRWVKEGLEEVKKISQASTPRAEPPPPGSALAIGGN